MPEDNATSQKTSTKSHPDLSQRAFKGGGWLLAVRISQQLLRLIILARLITPELWGLMGFALVTIEIMSQFSQSGFHTALIQKKNTHEYLNAAWSVEIVRSLSLFLLLFLAAPWIAGFFGRPDAAPIIRVTGISFLLAGFTNVGTIYFVKELEFHKHFLFRVSGTVTELLVTVACFLKYHSVWALVAGKLAGEAVMCLMSYLLHPYRPRWNWRPQQIKELWTYGKWILAAGITMCILNHTNAVLLGKLFGAVALGYYRMGQKIAAALSNEIVQIVSQVSFPAYALIQDDTLRLKNAFLKVLRFSAFACFPAAGLMVVLAPDFVRLFLTEKWLPITPVLQLLALHGLIKSVFAHTGSLLHAIGKPKWNFLTTSLRTLLMLIILYPLVIKYQLVGACLALLIPALAVKFITVPIILHASRARLTEFLKELYPPFLATLAMVLVVLGAKFFHPAPLRLPAFFLLASLGLLVYAGLMALLNRSIIHECKSLFAAHKIKAG